MSDATPHRTVSLPTLAIVVLLTALAARTLDRLVTVSATWHSVTIVVDWSGQVVPPTPDPEPKPKPDPPTPAAKPRVLFLADSTRAETRDQAITLDSSLLRSYLGTHCVADADGRPAWRFWDKATPVKDEPAEWQAAMSAALAEPTPLPKFSVFVGGRLAGTYPVTTEAAALETLRKWGGD